MRTLDVITTILLIIGGLNWGLVGLFEFDLVAALFGTLSWFTRLVYVLVGLSAIYQAASYKAIQRRWCSRVAVSAR